MGTTDSDLEYCAGLVRKSDPDRFSAAMLLPPPVRARLIAIYAFNVEIARTRETVSEPMLGEIRLQWWRDAVEECVSGDPRRHMVVQPLSAAIREASIPGALFLEAIDARSRDLDDLPPADLDELARYVDGSGGAIGVIAAHCAANGRLSSAESDAARAVGRAWAWIGLARGCQQIRRAGRRVIPADILGARPALDREIETAKVSGNTKYWIETLVQRTDADLDAARRARGSISKSVWRTLAPGAMARRYSDLARRADFDPFQLEVARLTDLDRALRLTLFCLPPRRL